MRKMSINSALKERATVLLGANCWLAMCVPALSLEAILGPLSHFTFGTQRGYRRAEERDRNWYFRVRLTTEDGGRLASSHGPAPRRTGAWERYPEFETFRKGERFGLWGEKTMKDDDAT